jgi:hypothetical protein
MKVAFFLFIILLLSFLSAFAAELKQVYYRDYDLVNRIVFVFTDKPDMRIIQNDKILELIFPETGKDEKVKDFRTSENKVFHKIDYRLNNGLSIQISTDTLSTYKYFRYRDNTEHKLVLDIYRITEPATLSEYESFIRFYERVGYKKQALIMQNRLDSLKNVEAEKVSVENEPIPLPQNEELSIIRHQPVFENDAANSILPYLIIFYTLILTQLLVFYLLGRTVKKQKMGEFTEGLGDEDLEEELALMLQREHWSTQAISRELWISPAKVKLFLKR